PRAAPRPLPGPRALAAPRAPPAPATPRASGALPRPLRAATPRRDRGPPRHGHGMDSPLCRRFLPGAAPVAGAVPAPPPVSSPGWLSCGLVALRGAPPFALVLRRVALLPLPATGGRLPQPRQGLVFKVGEVVGVEAIDPRSLVGHHVPAALVGRATDPDLQMGAGLLTRRRLELQPDA